MRSSWRLTLLMTGMLTAGALASPSYGAASCPAIREGKVWTVIDEPSYPTAVPPETSTPSGEWVQPFAAAPGVLLVSNGRDIMRSTDGGCTWTSVYRVAPGAGTEPYDGSPNYGVGSLTAGGSRPTYAYAVILDWFEGALAPEAADLVSGAYVVVSRDGGQTWQPPVGGFGYCRDATVTAAPSDPRTAYLLCSVGGAVGTRLFATRDGGVSWGQLNPPARPLYDANAAVHQIAIDQSNANDIWVRAVSGDGLMQLAHTVDGGRAWTTSIQERSKKAGTQSGLTTYRSSPQSAATIITWDASGLRASRDAGRSWRFWKVEDSIGEPVEEVQFLDGGERLLVFAKNYVGCSGTRRAAFLDLRTERWAPAEPPSAPAGTAFTRLYDNNPGNADGAVRYFHINGTYYCSSAQPGILRLQAQAVR